MFSLAHFSDPHISPLPDVRWRELAGKRLSGYLSWTRNRAAAHPMAVVDALVADMRAAAPDHIALTGDIVNISLPGEFSHAAAWLKALGPPDRISVVPGNHDAYVPMAWPQGLGLWDDYMTDDETGAVQFPYVRKRGRIALIGLSSATPKPVFIASGTLGADQIARAEVILTTLGRDGFCRIVLIHHPPLHDQAGWRKRLTDARSFSKALARAGAELVLHGHIHEFDRRALARANGPDVPVLSVPSASANGVRKSPAHYHLFHIEPNGAGWRIMVEPRGYDPASQTIVARDRYAL
jgi:3',5'-cyclic AMP phosphodiesterase CpdA